MQTKNSPSLDRERAGMRVEIHFFEPDRNPMTTVVRNMKLKTSNLKLSSPSSGLRPPSPPTRGRRNRTEALGHALGQAQGRDGCPRPSSKPRRAGKARPTSKHSAVSQAWHSILTLRPFAPLRALRLKTDHPRQPSTGFFIALGQARARHSGHAAFPQRRVA